MEVVNTMSSKETNEKVEVTTTTNEDTINIEEVIDRYAENRLLRRIVRDNRTRGANAEKTLSTWTEVRNGEEKYIFPYINDINRIVNTSLVYEVGVLKVYAEPLLYSVKSNSKASNEARRLINFLRGFFHWLSSAMVPAFIPS